MIIFDGPMTPYRAANVLNAREHLGRTDWHVGKCSGDVFGGKHFIPAERAVNLAKEYLNHRPKARP